MTFERPSTRAVAATLAAAAIGLLAPACSSGSSDAGKDSAVSISDSAASIDATTTTVTAETTAAPTATAPVATGLDDQEAVVQRLYDAWKADDKVTAATVADQTAVDGMWLTEPGDYSQYNQCSTGEFDTSGCLYRGNNGTIQFTVEKRGNLWVAIEAFYAAP